MKYDHGRAVRLLTGLFCAAVLVSVVHYTDNYVNFNNYPQGTTGLNPPAAAIIWAWFLFTAAGIPGYLLFRRFPSSLAITLLAIYSFSGLIGIGHYLVPGATSMPWWRQAHVIFDIVCGVGLFSFAVWAIAARRRYEPHGLIGGR
jgi:hypothetical protein